MQSARETPPLTLRAAIDDYLTTMRVEGYSVHTIQLYGVVLRVLADGAERRGAPLLSQLTPALVRQTQTDMLNKPAPGRAYGWNGGQGMTNALVWAVKGMVRRLGVEGIDVPNLSMIRSSKPPERIQPRVTGPEFRALERAIASRVLHGRSSRFLIARDLAIVQVLADTGLRASEFCALNFADVDFTEGSILVRGGKGHKDRALNIIDPSPTEIDGGPTIRALTDYLSHREHMAGALLEPALWLTIKGNRLNPGALRRVLAALCADAGIEGNRPPHAFRRGWFTTSYQADPNALPILSARMGWSPKSRHMVETYTKGAEVDFARTHGRPSVSKAWRDAAPLKEANPRPKPEAVQRQENMGALLAYLQGDPALRKALLQALGAS